MDLRRNWRWASPIYSQNPSGVYVDAPQLGDRVANPHGTGMLSKIGGLQYGIAKNANTIIVRKDEEGTLVNTIKHLAFCIDDWRQIRQQAPVKVGIINMSFGFPATPTFKSRNKLQNDLLNQWRDLLNEAVEEGLLPIAASGNGGGVSNIAIQGGLSAVSTLL